MLPLYRRGQGCPKCGHTELVIQWIGEVTQGARQTQRSRLLGGQALPGTNFKAVIQAEHLAVDCKTCQYKWACRPLDQADDLEKLAALKDEVDGPEERGAAALTPPRTEKGGGPPGSPTENTNPAKCPRERVSPVC